MRLYRRSLCPGGTYFFTVVTRSRRPVFSGEHARACLHDAFETTRAKQPFEVVALCLMPDHIHCILRLPENDGDYPGRWRRIKLAFTRLHRSGAQGVAAAQAWQRGYWEHLIRNDDDLRRHVEYIHYNPVKHGLAPSPADWPWSSFHRYVREGTYPADWGQGAGQWTGDVPSARE